MKLYVGNVPFQASEEDLSDWFTKAGFTVDNIDLVRDRYTDQSGGFGFVEIRNDEEAEHAIHVLNGNDFPGRVLTVNEARPRREGRRRQGDQGQRGGGRRHEW